MSKTTTRSWLAKPQVGEPARGRNAESPSAPIRVTEVAQAKAMDIYKAKQIGFSQIDHNKLPERPHTSGGPSSKWRNAESKETKDDLHFNHLGVYGTGTTFYNFPLPGSLPIASRTSFAPIRNSSLPRADTQESTETTRYISVSQMEIGLALGSPTHQPLGWHPQASSIPSDRNRTPDSVETYVDSDSHVSAVPKQRASRWKIFGGLFGGSKKGAGSPQAFYQLQPERAVVQSTKEVASNSVGGPVQSKSRRSKSQPRNIERQKPDLKRSQTAPLNFGFQGSPMTQIPTITFEQSTSKVQPESEQRHEGPLLNVDIPSVAMERYSIMFGNVLQKPGLSSSPLLARRQATLDRLKTVNEELAPKGQELDEKEKHLRPRRATSPQLMRSPAFSLFPITLSGRSSREGSSSPSRHALQRSNTSPAALSPSRPTFAADPNNEARATLMAPGPHIPIVPELHVELKSCERVLEAFSKQAAEMQSNSRSSIRNESSEELDLALDSPTSDIDEGEAVVINTAQLPMKPKIDEPNWQIITPHHAPIPSISGSISSSSDHSTSTSASTMSITTISTFASSHVKTVEIQAPPQKLRPRSSTISSTVIQPHSASSEAQSILIGAAQPRRKGSQTWFSSSPVSLPTLVPEKSLEGSASKLPSAKDLQSSHHRQTQQQPGEEDIEARLKLAADVSIARQISVSHQQRQLLVPIKVKSNPNLTLQLNPDVPAPLKIAKVNRVASSLHTVVVDSPVDRKDRPTAERKNSTVVMNEKLVAADVKPGAPVLVVVGGKENGTARHATDTRGRSGEDRVGLVVGSGGMEGMGRNNSILEEVYGHQHRKRESVVVDEIGVAS